MTKKTRLRLMAFLAPLLILFIIYMVKGVYPFGDRCILHIDMYHQYAPFHAELMEKLKTFGSPFFSWNIGVGSDFLATYAYYLSSPLNFLLGIFPRKGLIEAMTFFITIKAAVAGLAEYLYLEHRTGKEHICLLAPSLFYALSGFFCAYYWDIMWLDAVALFPLIILGLERLMTDGRFGLYALTLTIAIWSNYYISIMICIFIVIWFFLTLAENCPKGRRLKCIGKTALVSLLSGGISAVLILPEIAILGISGSGNNQFPGELSIYYNPLEGLARGFFGLPVTTTEGKLPNIYCGVFVIFLLLLYLLNRRISKGAKIRRAVLLVFFQLSFCTNVLEYIWHGFHFPEGLPARQSFLYIFVLLAVATETFFSMAGNSIRDIVIAGVGSVSLTVILWFVVPGDSFPAQQAVATVLFLGGYLLLYLLARHPKSGTRAVAFLGVLLLSVVEVSANFVETGFDTTSRPDYTAGIETARSLAAEQREKDPGFWRMERYERLMKDENLLSGYPSASLFSSLINMDVADAFHEAGMEGGKNYYCYNGATPLFSSMLQVKYMLLDNGNEESPLKKLIAEKDDLYLYENTYSLPLGFLTDEGLEERWDREDGSCIETVNGLASALGAGEELLRYVGEEEGPEEGTVLQAEEDGYYYGEMKNTGIPRVFVTRGDVKTTLSKTTHHYLLDLGYLKKGESLTVSASNDEAIDVTWYVLDLDVLDKAYQALSRCVLNVTEWKDTRVRGDIQVDEPGRLVLGIPQESGWTVEVDGKLKDSETFMGSYIAIPLEVGYHNVELKYRTPWFGQGAAISAGCFTGLFLWWFVEKRKKKDEKEDKVNHDRGSGRGGGRFGSTRLHRGRSGRRK